MINPFEPGTKENEFFKQMTNAISDWMLKQYPEFDTSLTNKIQEITRLQNEFKMVINEFRNDTKNVKQKETHEFLGHIDSFLKKEYPDISSKLTEIAKTLDNRTKTMGIKDKEMNEKLNKIVQSNSIYEDVYKLRDEFKEIQKFMEGFQKKLKKVFEI